MGKRYKNNFKKVQQDKNYTPGEAFQILDSFENAKFDESIDVAIRLGVDPKQSDQMVRGSVVLPHGTGKKIKLLVFAKGDKLKEVESLGVDYAGGDEFISKIQGGWLDFDKVIATPDMMSSVSKVAKILGPKGLMPNPKSGTVTFEVAKAVEDERKGKVEFRIDKSGIVHTNIGKKSFGSELK
ncbi:MAG: 50S ribosomal protein L1 [Deltaproteobacteria bacterium]|nr:50S ribosomal protein L1 [Deltaproteobacteria bacterium]